jgi:hypothetical protein
MSHSIICLADQKAKNYSDFFFLESNPDPCCLTFGDFFENDEPARWAKILFEPEDVVELRMLPPRGTAGEFLSFNTKMLHGVYPWTQAKGMDSYVPKLERLNQGAMTCWRPFNKETDTWKENIRRQDVPLNIYASANPRRAKGGKRCEDVSLARCVFVELDKISVEEALQKVEDLRMPTPTMTVCSGHGVHFYWRLNEPIADLAYWTSIQKRLIQIFESDPSVHDAARVMRIPGFVNVNGELARCYIHEADASRRYSLNDLLALLPPGESTEWTESVNEGSVEQTQALDQNQILNNIDKGISLYGFNGINGDASRKQARVNAYSAKFDAVETNRNSTLFKQACNLVDKFDLSQEETLEQVGKVNDRSSKPLDPDELEEVVGKAANHIKRKGKRKKTDQPLRFEKFVEPISPIIKIEDWREQMQKARLGSLSQPGKIFFDGSTTGAGKSTADLAAMKAAGRSATFLPTHDACLELAAKLCEQGLQAASHPPLDSTTCQLFGTKSNPGPAQLSQNAGLNVGLSVCPNCDFQKDCIFQRHREIARNADHTIATHARASLSDFEPADGKPVTFFHEDVVDLLKPMVKVVRKSNKKTDPQLCHLVEILRIAEAAEQITLTWADQTATKFAKNLVASTKELIDEISDDDLVKPFIDSKLAGKQSNALCSVMALPTRPKSERFFRTDFLLRRAMTSINLFSNGPALRLALAYCHGELESLTAVVDEVFIKGGKPLFTKGLVGVWKNDFPNDAVVWIENASTTSKALMELTQTNIVDKTPIGRLDYKIHPIQYPDCDITQNSSGNTVRSVLRGLLAKDFDKKCVGVISHKCHVAEIEKLAPLWRNRIKRIEYFHGGKDRASNSWLDCDLIIVLGTPRVSPSAIRDHLIRIGRIDRIRRVERVERVERTDQTNLITLDKSFGSFGSLGCFGSVVWEGKRISGDIVRVEGLGYSNRDWSEVNNRFVKETLLQAVGRGRGVTDKGVPVLVVSCESIGLPISDQPLRLIGDSEDETLRLAIAVLVTKRLTNLTARNAIYITIGELAVTQGSKPERTLRDHLSYLSLSGLLSRRGQRGGWTLADWLIAEE